MKKNLLYDLPQSYGDNSFRVLAKTPKFFSVYFDSFWLLYDVLSTNTEPVLKLSSNLDDGYQLELSHSAEVVHAG